MFFIDPRRDSLWRGVELNYGGPESRRLRSFDLALEKKTLVTPLGNEQKIKVL